MEELRAVGSEDRLERAPRELRTGFLAALLPWFVSRSIIAATLLWTTTHSGGPVNFSAFKFWDVNWYAAIAHNGYAATTDGAQTAWPFFPLVPAILRGGKYLGLAPEVTAVLVWHAVFLVGLWGVYVIARRHTSPRGATLTVWVLALFPISAVFSTAYPAGLVLASSVWAFILVEDERYGWAAVLVVAATLARPNGIVVAIVLAASTRSLRRAAVVAGPALLAFGGWLVALWILSGSPFSFVTTKSAWEEITVFSLIEDPGGLLFVKLDILLVGLGVVALLWQRRTLPRSWLLFAGFWLLPSLFTGMAGLARYTGQCFPASAALGQLMGRWPRPVAIGALIASSVLLVVVSYKMEHTWVP